VRGGLITRLILADISGHGASVGELGRSLRELMRRNINRKSQSRLVRDLNRQFSELAKLSRFATAVVGTYLSNRDQLTLSNAGHPRPLWFRAATGQWHFVDANDRGSGALANLPLGVDDSTSYPLVTLDLAPDDRILIYTDALIEAAGRDGQLLGEPGLLELLRSIDPGVDLQAMAGALVDRLDRYRGGRPADDDTTFLLLHHNAGDPGRLSVRQKLDVYAKVFHLKSV
jgi:serine phosphatase RsbU (regulator of sigma subunit)